MDSTLDWTEIFQWNRQKHESLLKKHHITNHDLKNIFHDLDLCYLEQHSGVSTKIDEPMRVLSEYCHNLDIPQKMRLVLSEGISDAKILLHNELTCANKRHGRQQFKNKTAISLENNGIYKTYIEKKDVDILASLAQAHQSAISAERSLRGKYVAPISIPIFSPLFRTCEDLLIKTGIKNGIEEYLGAKVYTPYVALQESLESETWWKNPLGENGLEYLHLDYDFDIIKTIIYLGEVREDNGPFKYIDNSTNLNYSRSWLAFYKCLERKLQKYYGTPMGIDGGYYYRTRFYSKDFLNDTEGLPKQLLGASHFGDDIAIGSEFYDLLRTNERQILSTEANCFSFDGSRLIHRGGMVTKGRRLAIQVGMMAKNRSIRERIIRAKNYLRAYTRVIIKGQ